MGKGLVHQDDGPILAERSRERRALAHAGGKRLGKIARPVAEPHFREQHTRPGAGGLEGRPVAAQAIAEQDIVQKIEPRQQQVTLRHIGRRLHAPGSRQEAGQPAQQGGLAHAAAAQQAGRPAAGKVEREAARHHAVAKDDARVAHGEGRGSHHEVTSPYAGINRIRFGVVLANLSAAVRLPPMN